MKTNRAFLTLRGLAVLSSVFAFAPLHAKEMREITDVKGRKIEAELIELTEKNSVKVRINGKPFDIPLDQLVKEDQEWLREWAEEKKDAAEGNEYAKVLFSDDFAKDGFGEAWGHYKSGSEVKDGVLKGFSPDVSDHAAVDNVKIEGQQDVEISVKFLFAGLKGKQFNVWMDDYTYKGSHAGHICSVSVGRNYVSMSDAKEGSFKNEIYEKKKAGQELDKETLKSLEGKSARFEVKLKEEDWHTLMIRTNGEEVTAFIDGRKVGTLKSQGISHETKTLISLTTNEAEIHYDDFSIKTRKRAKKKS
jgi:hypothetical protein